MVQCVASMVWVVKREAKGKARTRIELAGGRERKEYNKRQSVG